MTSNQDDGTSKLHVDDIIKSLQNFQLADYSIFVFMLIICACVGIYFAYKDHQNHKRKDEKPEANAEALNYLVGGRNLQIFPVAMSLVASWVSGISLLGTGTEIYLYGCHYVLILIPIYLMSFSLYYVTIPIYNELQITSIYEYLEKRFDKRLRSVCSIMYSASSVMLLPIVIYVPALAFNQVTGVNIHVVSPIVCLVCIFYTLVGGIQAVIWTDVIQIMLMYGTLFLIMIKGTWDVGGLSVVLERNLESGRIDYPDFNIDPTVRNTFWTVVFGGYFFWVNTNACNQSIVQRFLSLNSVKSARRALMVYTVGISFMIFLCAYNGFLLYATYYDCDPLQTKLAKAKDQLLPLLVMDILKDLPGLSGLFIAGVFSAALSSLSTSLNSLSAVVLEDFFKSFSKRPFTERETAIIMRATVFIIGSLAVALVYVVEHLGSVLQLSMSLPTISFGPMLGIFILGMFVPWITSKGALAGLITAVITMSYVVFKSQADMALGKIKFQTMPRTTDGCTYEFVHDNKTLVDELHENEKSLHNMSYFYYTIFGTLTCSTVATIYCLITGFNDPDSVDLRLIAPFLRKYFKGNKSDSKTNGGYLAVQLEEKHEMNSKN